MVQLGSLFAARHQRAAGERIRQWPNTGKLWPYLTMAEIGRHLGVNYMTVCRAVRDFE